MKADRVLVPLDGSPLAERALPVAIDVLSDRPGATLILMRAAETKTAPGAEPTDAQVAAVGEAQSYLKALADRLRDQGFSRAVMTSVWSSAPVHAIAEAARTRRANVIVMSARLRSGLGRGILSPVPDSVMRGTRTPILIVPAGHGHLDVQGLRTAVGEMDHVRVA